MIHSSMGSWCQLSGAGVAIGIDDGAVNIVNEMDAFSSPARTFSGLN